MVYLPREDSQLLLSCAERLPLQGKRVLEMGVGSGFVVGSLSQRFRGEFWGADVDREAVEEVRRSYPSVRAVESNLFEGLPGTFDVILFNPPYLSQEEGEAFDRTIHDDGVVERFIWEVGGHLAERGFFLIILSDAHRRFQALKELLFSLYSCRLCRKKGVGFETLYAFLCTHPFASPPAPEGLP